MPLSNQTRQFITSLLEKNDVVLFMKGDRRFPQCGFSARVVQMLDGILEDYKTVDVLASPELRDGIKEFSSWPTIPQLYVKGELIGGSDIVSELFASGELYAKLGREAPPRVVPEIALSDPAAERLSEASRAASERGLSLHLTIGAGSETKLGLAPAQDGEIEVEVNGVTLFMDPLTAQRAEGMTIDLVDTADGPRFRVAIAAA